MAETFLERIVAATQRDLAERQARVPLDELRARAAAAPAPRPFREAIHPTPKRAAALIAEVKRASPSKGLLVETFDPVAQARAYAAGGAAAISVLTEPHFFLGALEHLRAVRAAVDVPVLRKDFILDPYQVYESRAAGADALLLICALLDDAALRELLALTRSLGMEALVEAHNAEEVQRALAADARVIGVNSRDLRTFAVDTAIVRRLRPLVPADRTFVAESGIADALGAARARAWGADAILVGEALMRAAAPQAMARELATAPSGAMTALFRGAEWPFIKLCGLATPEQGALAAELGANAMGLVFAPQAPPHRRVTAVQAREISDTIRNEAMDMERIVWPVGVFVNEPLESLLTTAYRAGLLAVQLSGDETPEYCAEVQRRTRFQIIKAIRLRAEADLERLDAYAMAGAALLLDTPSSSGAYGGTGETGDWELARRAAERWPVILSGGLAPENVAGALAAAQPRGVDVSSGIETHHAKDPEKMRAFVHAARTASALMPA
ncbi:MAG: Indole-3-glycerol phosphate synthase [Ktedonobacterales bacterium]|jgi:indole-3-glycerol phosphate synthase/phosphoribosylanthranilate isomerase/anthranilate synthase/indole-3-glycerol phosphate synthase/phosphoribosylanthranilate isomerase|nr:MAG: Indole-3-glycerol phosphate synthase [Ktedonobacterales bacterium]